MSHVFSQLFHLRWRAHNDAVVHVTHGPHALTHIAVYTQGSRELWTTPVERLLDFRRVVTPRFRPGMVLSRRQARPGLQEWCNPHIVLLEKGSLERGLSTVPNRRSQPQSVCHDQQQAQRGGLWCRTVKVVFCPPNVSREACLPAARPAPCSHRCPRCNIRGPCRRMSRVEPAFSLEASASQSGCGSSHTSVPTFHLSLSFRFNFVFFVDCFCLISFVLFFSIFLFSLDTSQPLFLLYPSGYPSFSQFTSAEHRCVTPPVNRILSDTPLQRHCQHLQHHLQWRRWGLHCWSSRDLLHCWSSRDVLVCRRTGA